MMRDILQSRYLRRRVAHKQLARTSLNADFDYFHAVRALQCKKISGHSDNAAVAANAS